MSIRILLMGAAALAMAAPTVSLADPGKNHGGGHHSMKAHSGHGNAGKQVRSSKRMSTGNRYAGKACPPGLAKKYPGCIPPGQWKKGYRIPSTWSDYYVGYDRLPEFYRDRYEMNPDYRYMYRDGRVYVIDAITRSIVNVLTR